MIILENTEISGWKAAIRGMRNPMNSWDKSDSIIDPLTDDFVAGVEDYRLMKQLVSAGSDHSKFMRMINVTVDVTAPLYWWKEMDTYKIGTVRNSCSTMHKIHAKEFTVDDFSHEHLSQDNKRLLDDIIAELNANRETFLFGLYCDDLLVVAPGGKDEWWQMIQLLPSSYNQRATLQMNYAVLRNIYHSRKNHKLDEWRTFCAWIERLSYSELITL